VQEFFAALAILKLPDIAAAMTLQKTRKNSVTEEPSAIEVPAASAISSRGNDSLRKFVAAGLVKPQDIMAFIALLWVKPFSDWQENQENRKKDAGAYLFSSECLGTFAESIREMRSDALQQLPVKQLLAERADTLWNAVKEPGATAAAFAAGGSKAVTVEFWIVCDAFLAGEKSRKPSISALEEYLAALCASGNPSHGIAAPSIPPVLVSIDALRAVNDRSEDALSALRRLRDELKADPGLRLAAIIALSVLASSGPLAAGEVEQLLTLAIDAAAAMEVRLGAIRILGMRHADDAAVRDKLLGLLFSPVDGEEQEGEEEAAPVPFALVRAIVTAVGVQAVPPDFLSEVLVHPDASEAWSRAVALQALEFWVATQMRKGGGVYIDEEKEMLRKWYQSYEPGQQAEKCWKEDTSELRIRIDDSWTLWHACAALGLTAVLEELSAREAAVKDERGGGTLEARRPLLTRSGWSILRCALAASQWELAGILLMTPVDAEKAGYGLLGRLNERATILVAARDGHSPALYTALRLGAPTEILQPLIKIALLETTFPDAPAPAPISSADGTSFFGSEVAKPIIPQLSSNLCIALACNAPLDVVSHILSNLPAVSVIAAQSSFKDLTALDVALDYTAPASIIRAIIEAARDEWCSLIADPSVAFRLLRAAVEGYTKADEIQVRLLGGCGFVFGP
jgi:hypothetical protein